MNPKNPDTGAVHVFTSAACNYAAKVRVLFRSLRRHHPEWRLHWLVPDDAALAPALLGDIEAKVWTLPDLDIPALQRWMFGHTLVELATAVKPFLAQRLLAEGDCGAVLYFDPDIAVFSRLDDLLLRFDSASVLLTPHQTRPEFAADAVVDNEICSLKHGVYNLGFIGIANDALGRHVVSWWRERTYRFCRDDIPHGLFTDQRWIDLAPALFDRIGIVRDSRFNVATWNLTTRTLGGHPQDSLTVDGQPLGFYHFSGWDSGAHRTMAAKYAASNPAVGRLLDWYDRCLRAEQPSGGSALPWAYGKYSDGTPIAAAHRAIYRDRADLQRAFADPYNASQMLHWVRTQGVREYPWLAHDDAQSGTKARSLSVAPVGWRALDRVPSGRASAGALLLHGLRHPRDGWALAQRAWLVARRDGLGALARRLLT